jgi:hypothetical protein
MLVSEQVLIIDAKSSRYLEINYVHLLSNALERGLGTQGCKICTNITMCLTSDLRFGGKKSDTESRRWKRTRNHLLEINIVLELHVLGVDTEALHTPGFIRDTNVNLAIETTEAAKCGVNTAQQYTSHSPPRASAITKIHTYSACLWRPSRQCALVISSRP